MRFGYSPVFFSAAAVLLAALAQAQDKPKLAVLDLRAQGVDQSVARNLTDLLVMQLDRLGKYEVISRNEVTVLLQQEMQRQMMGCDEVSCMAEIAGALNARKLVTGSIGKLGSTYLLQLELINQQTVTVEQRVSQSLAGDKDDLASSLRGAVLALMAQEEGLSSDITVSLIDDLKIAEKLKTFNVNVRLGIEFPIGNRADSATGLMYLQPTYWAADLDLAYHVRQWLHLTLTTGYHFSASSTTFQNKLTEVDEIFTPSAFPGADSVAGAGATAIEGTVDYAAWKIPLYLGVKFRRPAGTLLPYFHLATGVSLQRFFPGDEQAKIFLGQTINEDWFATRGIDTSQVNLEEPCGEFYQRDKESGMCVFRVTLKPENNNMALLSYDGTAAIGFDYLLTGHFGFGVEGRYTFNLLLNAEDERQVTYLRGNVAGDVPPEVAQLIDDDATRTVSFVDLFPLNPFYQSLQIGIIGFFYF